MSSKGQHVVPRSGKWAVRSAGAVRATGVFTTRQEAIARATEIAKSQRTELYVHGLDGRILTRSSFGKNVSPSKE